MEGRRERGHTQGPCPSPFPRSLLLLPGPGGTLWSHLLSQTYPQHSGLRSGSTQEKVKAQLNTSLSLGLLTPAQLPPGHTLGQASIPLEPPWTSQSLPAAREAPSLRPQRETESESTGETSISCSLDLTIAPRGLHLQARWAGQSSDPRSPWGLPWVRKGAGRVLGGCGRGRGQSHPSAGRASLGGGGAVWSVEEEKVKQWAAEMLVALEALHEQGVLCQDLNPRNLLLDQAGRSPHHTALPCFSGGMPPGPGGPLRLCATSPTSIQPFTQDSAGVWLVFVPCESRAAALRNTLWASGSQDCALRETVQHGNL